MKRKFLVMAAALLFSIPLTVQSKAPLPQSQSAADQSWKIPKDCDSFACSLKLVEPGVVKIILETEDGKDSRTVTIQPVPQKLTQKGKPDEVFQNQALLFLPLRRFLT